MEKPTTGGKSPIQSKTFHFNIANTLIISAIWPFIPESFRNNEYAVPAITAWITIGNIILRVLTRDAIVLSRGEDNVKEDGKQEEIQ